MTAWHGSCCWNSWKFGVPLTRSSQELFILTLVKTQPPTIFRSFHFVFLIAYDSRASASGQQISPMTLDFPVYAGCRVAVCYAASILCYIPGRLSHIRFSGGCLLFVCLFIRISSFLLFSCWVMSDSFATPWTVAYQAPLSVRFSKQAYWSG